MENKIKMWVKEVFSLSDGKIIFLGPLSNGPLLVTPGKWMLHINGVEFLVVDITGEQIMTRRAADSTYRAFTTHTPISKNNINTTDNLVELMPIQSK
jgi:hypothetical protein